MEVTPEMKAALEKQMTAYLEEYFNANASDALREKVKAENKTVTGAYKFIESVAREFAKANVCAMPDALAYNLLMHYMEDEAEGAIYRTPEQIQADIEKARRAEEKAKAEKEAKAKAEKEAKEKAEKKAKAEAKAKAKAEKEARDKAIREKVAEENANALIKTSEKAIREGEKAVETEKTERARTIAQMKKAEKLETEMRNAEAVANDKPVADVEVRDGRVVQCYAKGNTRPAQPVIELADVVAGLVKTSLKKAERKREEAKP